MGYAPHMPPPTNVPVSGFDVVPVVFLGVVLAVVFLPAILGRPAPKPDPPESDGDDGPGWGPPRPPSRPDPPLSGLPLPEAEQSRLRLRDHERPGRRVMRRRSVRHPDRSPPRVPTP